MLEKINNLIKHLWSLRRQFAKYFITGTSGVILDMITLIILKELVGLSATIAIIINQPLLLIFIFCLNKYWSFRDKAQPHKQIVRFLILAGLNYLFGISVMYIFNHKLNFDYRLVRICSIAIMVCWNFFLYKYWVYKQDVVSS